MALDESDRPQSSVVLRNHHITICEMQLGTGKDPVNLLFSALSAAEFIPSGAEGR